MASRSALPPVALFSLVIAACGGEDLGRPSNDPIAVPAVDHCAVAADYADRQTLITSFDAPSPTTPVSCSSPGIDCDFYFNYDSARSPARADGVLPQGDACNVEIHAGALVESPPIGQRLLSSETERCGETQGAFHFVAKNLGMCKNLAGRRGWGAAEEIDFKDRPGGNPQPIDASGWDGFSFWIKAGDGPTERALIVLAVDTYTAGQRNIIDPVTGEERACSAAEPTNPDTPSYPEEDWEKCDAFSRGVTIEDGWTFVPIRFADMRQKGFGMYSPAGLTTEELVRLQFLITAGDWDFWLDDVAFFRDPE